MPDDTDHPDEASHEKNTTVEGPKGPMLVHYCENSTAGKPKPGAAEYCPHCSVEAEDSHNQETGSTDREPLGYVADPENGEQVAILFAEDVLQEFQEHSYWTVTLTERGQDA